MPAAKRVDRDPFTATQAVWLVDTDNVEVDRIKEGLSPDVLKLSKFDTLVHTIGARLQGSEDSYGTLIVANQNLPDELRSHWERLVQAINSLVDNKKYHSRLFIYEINQEANEVHVFHNSVLCSDVMDFLAKAHNTHFDSVTSTDSDISDEARRMLMNTQTENAKLRTDAKHYKEVIAENTKKISNYQQQLTTLNQQIESYRVQAEKGEKAEQDAKDAIEKNKLKMKSLQKQIDDLNKQVNDYKSKNTDLSIENGSLKQHQIESNREKASLTQQLDDLNRELTDERNKNEQILNARNEMEENSILQESLNAEREKVKQANKEKIDAQQEKSVMEMRLEETKKELNDIRSGYKNVSRIGYSNNFGTIDLQSTDVIYFKVINSLPFHRFYINEFMNIFRRLVNENSIEGKPSQLIKIVYHRIDFGFDEQILGEYPQIGDLDAINDFHDHYRLMPSLNVGKNHSVFESDHHILIFVDYVHDNKYYVTTNGAIDYYSIVQHGKLAKDMGLKGNTISYDHDSILNLIYNPDIINFTEDNKRSYYIRALSNLVQSSIVVRKHTA